LSVGFTNNEINKDFRSSSNANAILSGGISTNEDTYTSNGALKKSDESSFAGNLSELQTTKLSNEAVDKENNVFTSGVHVPMRTNRIGDIIDKRR
jgi:hypothetical protein